MNHIQKLQMENEQMHDALTEARKQLIDLLMYYSSEKFQGTENDYAHVSTDVRPRINEIKNFIQDSIK